MAQHTPNTKNIMAQEILARRQQNRTHHSATPQQQPAPQQPGTPTRPPQPTQHPQTQPKPPRPHHTQQHHHTPTKNTQQETKQTAFTRIPTNPNPTTYNRDLTHDKEKYPHLFQFAHKLKPAEREIVGREAEMNKLLSAMYRPELCNALLLAAPGTGKTALVQMTMLKDTNRLYLEVDLARMTSGVESNEVAARLKSLFDAAEQYTNNEGIELVLFIDEFHQIVQISAAAVEALKPVLAASGTRGIRVIAATTYDEFHEYVEGNQPLMERLQRINITPTDKDVTIEILKGMATKYEVAEKITEQSIFEQIYDLTERYIPRSVQPRKSILVLDSLIGKHRFTKKAIDKPMLADVMKESTGVNISINVDANGMYDRLNKKVYAQELAVRSVTDRLHVCIADLHDKNKPMATMLFTGSTGVGKTELTKQIARELFGDDTNRLIRFDMSEYAESDSINLFRVELSRKVSDMGHGILLLDEVEKAAPSVIRLLLQVLDDGRLSDEHNRQVSFLNLYIIMTTNAGAKIFENIARYASSDTGDGSAMKDYMKKLRKEITASGGAVDGQQRFPPELLGRIDTIVPFQPLSRATQYKIVQNKIMGIRNELWMRYGVKLDVDQRVMTYLIDDNVSVESNEGGARAAVSLLNTDVLVPISKFINKHQNVKHIGVDVRGELVSESTERRTSDAYIDVVEIRPGARR